MRRLLWTALACLGAAGNAVAAELVVTVTGIDGRPGEIGCALFAAPPGFPIDISRARQVWLPPDAAGVKCRFRDVAEGRYAVAVTHDLDGRRKIDTNMFGAPTRPWGVSNNVRPMMRAPTFEEAAFEVGGVDVTIDVRLAR